MKRPILIATIAFIHGIIIGVYLKISIPLFVLSGLFIWICLIVKTNKYKSIIFIYTIIFLVSSIYTSKQNENYKNKYIEFDEKNVKIIGTVVSSLNIKENSSSFTVKVELLNNSKKFNGDYLLVSIKENKYITYGDKISFSGEYHEPDVARNYKGFSYKDYLKTKKIYGTVLAKDVYLIKQRNVNLVDYYINTIRNEIKNKLEKILPLEIAGVAQGVLIGDTYNIEDEIKEDFKNSNLAHMLAISGAHTSYVILAVCLLFNKKIVGKKIQKISVIVIMFFFIKLTGASPSIVRAGIVCIIYMLASLLYRRPDTTTALSVATVITLIENPFSLFSTSMQLSYAGTISIIIFNKIFDEHTITIKQKVLKYIKTSILVSLSANILIIPIMAYKFNTISLTFIFSNLFASPVLGVAIILGIATILISFINLKISYLPAFLLKIVLELLIKISNFFSNISFSKITVITPNIITIIMYYFLCAVIVYFYHTKKRPSKKSVAIIIIFIIIVQSIIVYPINNNFEIHFIDVKQGDSTLIKTMCGTTILIDSGGTTASSKFDIGSKVLLPYLLDRRISKLDYIIVSHFDSDHCQALEAILGQIRVEKLIISKQPTITSEYKKIINLAIKNNVFILKKKKKILQRYLQEILS